MLQSLHDFSSPGTFNTPPLDPPKWPERDHLSGASLENALAGLSGIEPWSNDIPELRPTPFGAQHHVLAGPALTPQPNDAEALAFLRRWPSAFPHLVDIHVDPVTHEKGRIEGQSFTHNDLDDGGGVARRIGKRQGKANQYFTVNTLIHPLRSKPAKTDVDVVVAFHIDIDVPEGEDQEAGTAKLLAAVRSHHLPPSAIISSGGGVQAFWILHPNDRIKIGGDKIKAEAAECYTRGLENEFRAMGIGKVDPCHNIDRIMRQPGTVNVPDNKKIAMGRKPALAKLVEFTDVTYPLSAFTPAAPKSQTSKPGNSPAEPIDWDAVEADDYDELPAALREKFRTLRTKHPWIDKLWDGVAAPSQTDISHSGFEFALAGALKCSGEFTSTEFAQLHAVWDHKSVKHAGDQRTVQRAWDRNRGPTASGFEVVEIPPLTETQKQQQQERKAQLDREAQDDRKEREANLREEDTPTPFSDLLTRATSPVQELIQGLIEKGTVTFLSAPGGSHKSRLAVQLGLCIDTATPAFGHAVERATFIYVSYEDHVDEVARRAQAITRELKLPEGGTALYFDLSGKDRPLAIVEESGACDPQPFWNRLVSHLQAINGHKFIVLDSTYDVLRFSGQAKINETSVVGAIKMLQRLCDETDSTVLALWHPSQSGQERGDASGWSVAWHNRPRARLSLTPIKECEDAYDLKTEKRNHGRKGQPIRLFWSNGALLPRSSATSVEHAMHLERAAVHVAIKAAETGAPMQRQRNASKWQLDAIADEIGRRPSQQEVKDVLAAALPRGLLHYLKGTTRRSAGYYPADTERAAELARDAKRQAKK